MIYKLSSREVPGFHCSPDRQLQLPDSAISDHEGAYLVRKLRNRFAHSLGRSDFNNPKYKSLFMRLNNYLSLNPLERIENAKDFPFSMIQSSFHY